ncbi:hypothetical protein LIA77_08406 [Sarocladium implicatum]|nr:hypothetical protein LIA77_08406 [Sarocladium implicatum]
MTITATAMDAINAAIPTAPPQVTFKPSWTTPPRSEWPTSHRAFWLWDRNHPDPLYASLISSWTSDYHSAMTYLVECPSDTCSTDFAKQTITHSDGSVWAGEHVSTGVTTTWACNLATNLWQSEHGYAARCTITSGKDVDLKLPLTQTSSLDNKDRCFVSARSVLVHITGGLDEFYKDGGWYPPPQQEDTELIRSWLTKDAEEVCPAGWTAVTTAEMTTAETSTTGSEPSAATTAEAEETGGSSEEPREDDGSRAGLLLGLVLGVTVITAIANTV